MEVSNLEKPVLIGRYWHMPDGSLVPYIAGGSDDGDGDGDGDGGNKGGTDDTELRKARSEAAKYRKQLRDLQDKVDGIDLEEYSNLKKEAEDAAKRKEEEKGNYQKLLDDLNRKHEAALAKANETGAGWKTRYESLVVDNQLLSAASKAVDPNAAMTLAKAQYKFTVLDDGNVEIAKGTDTLYDDKGTALTPAALMTKFLNDNPYLVKASDKAGSGGGDSGGGKPPAGDKSTQDKVKDGLAALLGG